MTRRLMVLGLLCVTGALTYAQTATQTPPAQTPPAQGAGRGGGRQGGRGPALGWLGHPFSRRFHWRRTFGMP